jgi:hypothetical protein
LAVAHYGGSLPARDGACLAKFAFPAYPIAQTGDPDFWQMEADIRLYHFSRGDGRNVLIIHSGPGLPFREPMSAWSR